MRKFDRFVICIATMILSIICLSGCRIGIDRTEPLDNTSQTDLPIEYSEKYTDFIGFERVGFIKEKDAIGASHNNPLEQSDVWCYYLREKLTNVMYIWRTSGKDSSAGGFSYWSSGITIMFNPSTGAPLLYDDWMQLLQQTQGQCGNCEKFFEDETPLYCPDCGEPIKTIKEINNG